MILPYSSCVVEWEVVLLCARVLWFSALFAVARIFLASACALHCFGRESRGTGCLDGLGATLRKSPAFSLQSSELCAYDSWLP